MRHTPLIALQKARQELNYAEEDCPHWDYESEGIGLACCNRLEEAKQSFRRAKAAWQKSEGVVRSNARSPWREVGPEFIESEILRGVAEIARLRQEGKSKAYLERVTDKEIATHGPDHEYYGLGMRVCLELMAGSPGAARGTLQLVTSLARANELIAQARELIAKSRSVVRNGTERSSLEQSIKIRENFRDEPHRRKWTPGWEWPSTLQEIGKCEAVMYNSDKWQKDGKAFDYKHVKEGPQQLFVVPGTIARGDGLKLMGPQVSMKGKFPDSFAVLAKFISIQAQLFTDARGKSLGEFVDLKWPRCTLGAGKFKDGKTFLVVYDSQGVVAVVTGSKLNVLKDGIVG
jgi:hypothetical protein